MPNGFKPPFSRSKRESEPSVKLSKSTKNETPVLGAGFGLLPVLAGHHKKLAKRINQLIRDTSRDPFCGIGKPERLRRLLKGYWSRRIYE
jgi:hypothetical protein